MKLSREKIDLYRANKCYSISALAEVYGVSQDAEYSEPERSDAACSWPDGRSSGCRCNRNY